MHHAAAVIVAVPPVAASRIVYDPPLPAGLAAALAAWESGAVIKLFLRYPTAFWRERGLAGMVAWRKPRGLFVCEASRDPAHPGLVGFVGGEHALEWSRDGVGRLKRWLVGQLVEALGTGAARPLDAHARDWCGDRWSAGGYGDVIMRMEARDAEGVIRRGVGPVRFAASELSPSFPGYVEGAIVAGRDAAALLP
jgi:monoamine oxidase